MKRWPLALLLVTATAQASLPEDGAPAVATSALDRKILALYIVDLRKPNP